VTNDLYKQRAAVLVKKPGGTEPTSNVLGKSAFFGDGGLKPLFLGNGGDRGPFAFIRDHGKFPYNNRSMGLLGVMRTFHESVYGAHRVITSSKAESARSHVGLWWTPFKRKTETAFVRYSSIS